MEVRREIVLPVPPEEVWEALTDPERLEEWFANEVELDATPGGSGVFRWGDGDERRATVEVAQEPERFAFDWGDDGSVEFTLEEVPDGTRLTIVETAPVARVDGASAPMTEWSWALELHASALVAA